MRHSIFVQSVFTACVVVMAVFLGACALTSKADLVEIRYFSPEVERSRPNPETQDAGRSDRALEMRLGRVSSGPNLRDHIAYRITRYELGYYDDLRWTEHPEAYVRRSLGWWLFQSRGLRRVLHGEAPTLEVELIAFDDLRLPTGRAAQVRLRVILFEETGVLLEETITINHPVPDAKPGIDDLVAAMSIALDAAAEQVATKVRMALIERARTPSIVPTVAQTDGGRTEDGGLVEQGWEDR